MFDSVFPSRLSTVSAPASRAKHYPKFNGEADFAPAQKVSSEILYPLGINDS